MQAFPTKGEPCGPTERISKVSPDEANHLVPGNRIILGDMPGKVHAIGYGQRPDDGDHYVKITVHLDNGGVGEVSGDMISELRRDLGAWDKVFV